MRMKRLAPGHYQTLDGKYEALHDPTTMGDWWLVYRTGENEAIQPRHPTLRAAKVAISRYQGDDDANEL